MVALAGNDLVIVVGTELEASLSPCVEVSRHVDPSASALVATDGPELLEGLGAINGGLLVAGADENIVGSAVVIDSSLVLSTAGGVVGAKVLNDVVFDERVPRPSVDSEVAVAVVLVGTRV